MNPERVRSKDHVELPMIFARLQEDGYLTREDIDTLKEIAERIEEPKLEWLADDVRYIGEGKFIPVDSENFVVMLDSIRYDIHRVIESRAESKYGNEIYVSDKELIAAIPDDVLDHYTVVATERETDGSVVREVEMRYGEDEIDLTVLDDLDAQRRVVKFDGVALVRSELEQIAADAVDEAIDEFIEECDRSDPLCYVASHTFCELVKYATVEGEPNYIYECTVDLEDVEKFVEPEERSEFKEEIAKILKTVDCTTFTRKDEIKAYCKYDVRSEIRGMTFEAHMDEIEERAMEIAGEKYVNEILPEFKHEWREIGEEMPIPLSCDVSFAYPHHGGFYFYARCRGEKEYDISLDSIAQSYKDIHDTLDRWHSETRRVWW